MKSTYLLIIGISISVMLLFFMVIYRSSHGKNFIGDTQISIKIARDIQLSKEFSDSLLYLVDTYEHSQGNYTQSTVSVLVSAKDSVTLSCPISGMNQFRSNFSNNFYTYAARKEDLNTMHENASLYTAAFKKKCSIKDNSAQIIVACKKNNSMLFESELSVAAIKSKVLQILENSRYVSIYFVNSEKGTIKDSDGDGVADNNDACPTKKGSAKNNGCPITFNQEPKRDDSKDDDQEEPKIQLGKCKKADIIPNLSFKPGKPNEFTWDYDSNYTYDFSLKCISNICDDAKPAINEVNIQEGIYRVYASHDESMDKVYLATLTVNCNGKKFTYTIKKRLVCG